MSEIALSQTAVSIGKKLAEVRTMRVNTHFDKKGNAVTSSWRDSKVEGAKLLEAVETLKSQGYKVTLDRTDRTITGKRAFKTRIFRLVKEDGSVAEPQPEPEPEPEQKPAKPARKPRGKRNAEQVEQQLA